MTKDNIIIAAMRLFLLKGYKNVSLVDVANEVGITKGGIYHYFDSKENLLQAAIQHLFECFEVKYDVLFGSSKSFYHTLRAVIVDREFEVYLEKLLEIKKGDYRTNHATLALEVIHGFPDFQQVIDNNHIKLLRAIEGKIIKSQRAGELKLDIDAHALAVILLSIMSGQNALGAEINAPGVRQQVLESLWFLIKV